MFNISRLIQDSLYLCATELAVTAANWVTHKYCAISSSYNTEESGIDPGKVQAGQGEYIAFHALPNGQKKELSRKTFEKVYRVFNHYAPAAIINRNLDSAKEEYSNRYALIRKAVKQIDPSLEIAFVPRTLYELIFLRKCIREDVKNGSLCEFLLNRKHDYPLEESFPSNYLMQFKNKIYQKKRKCWHLCYFLNAGDNNHPKVREVAYRLNKVIVKTLAPTIGGFTPQELSQHTERELDFLKTHHKQKPSNLISCFCPGPTSNFGSEASMGRMTPMGIRNEEDAQIVRNAVKLDCSETAQHSFLIYRGGDFEKDLPHHHNDKSKAYSNSFGTSLFAGSIYDGESSAFCFMRKSKNAYALPIPFEDLNDSPFYIPTTNTVAQLFGMQELFHARSKAWKDFEVEALGGLNFRDGREKTHIGILKSNLPKTIFIALFNGYKQQAIHLK